MNLLQTLEAEQMKAVRAKAHPEFRPGDTLKVNVKVVDVTFDEKTKQNKTRERLQAFEGVCIARQGQGLNESFHGAQDFLWRRRGARVSGLFAAGGFGHRGAQGQGPPGQALLSARPHRQVGAHLRARGKCRSGEDAAS